MEGAERADKSISKEQIYRNHISGRCLSLSKSRVSGFAEFTIVYQDSEQRATVWTQGSQNTA